MSKDLVKSVEKLVADSVVAANKDAIAYRKLLNLVLEDLFNDWQQAHLAAEHGSYHRAAERYAKFEAMLDLMETFDCGSTGGYSPEIRRNNGEGRPSIETRVNFILKKYRIKK